MGPKGPMHGDARSASTYTWFCSASCRVNFNYVVSLHFFFDYQIRKTQLLVFKFQIVESQFKLSICCVRSFDFQFRSSTFCFQDIDFLFVIFRFAAEPSSCWFFRFSILNFNVSVFMFGFRFGYFPFCGWAIRAGACVRSLSRRGVSNRVGFTQF